MSSNYQRALDLAYHIAEVDETPRELVKQLHQYGLLAPDPPQPDRTFEEGDASWELTPETVVTTWNSRGNYYYPGVILDIGDGFILGLEETRELAYMLLAAANHAEAQARGTTNG